MVLEPDKIDIIQNKSKQKVKIRKTLKDPHKTSQNRCIHKKKENKKK